MKTAFRILLRDLKALVTNPIAFLVVGALLVLPGLYAWYCIIANWDPYSNTGRMPIAVVNEDVGTSSSLTGELNIGKQVTEKIYPVSNYGTAVAPFYTNLALWIGCFILASLMKMEVDRRGFERASTSQRYYGRWLLFVILSLLQSQVICGVDILLGIDCANPALFMLAGAVCSFAYMNIQCVNPVLFVLFGLFIGQVFCLIVYTLTELFGDVGKALCVILLIMQVAASGGTFPAQMLDQLLENIVVFLPFYHAMSLLQECVAGINALSALFNIAFLIGAVVIMLLIGVVVRKPFRKLNDFFEEQLERTGYM